VKEFYIGGACDPALASIAASEKCRRTLLLCLVQRNESPEVLLGFSFFETVADDTPEPGNKQPEV
jgi:hypothetical protein